MGPGTRCRAAWASKGPAIAGHKAGAGLPTSSRGRRGTERAWGSFLPPLPSTRGHSEWLLGLRQPKRTSWEKKLQEELEGRGQEEEVSLVGKRGDRLRAGCSSWVTDDSCGTLSWSPSPCWVSVCLSVKWVSVCTTNTKITSDWVVSHEQASGSCQSLGDNQGCLLP